LSKEVKEVELGAGKLDGHRAKLDVSSARINRQTSYRNAIL
jgi:hypothetical protein